MALKKLPFVHRLSLRWKLFLTLVLFSVLPVCGTLLTVGRLADDIKSYLFTNTRNDLAKQASYSVENIAVNFAKSLENSERMRSVIVSVIEISAAHFLGMMPDTHKKLLYSNEIAPALSYPDDLIVDPSHAPTREYMVKYGSDVSKYISYGNIAFHLPKNPIERTRAKHEAAKLIRLLPLLKQLKKSYGSLVYNLYIGTENGLFAYYPAHAGIPDDYDPRKRVWYRFAVEERGLVWRAPLRDISTGRLVFTVSAPIFTGDGRIAGVVGLDVLIEKGLSNDTITAAWTSNAHLMLAREVDNKKTGSAGLQIVAHTFRRSANDTEYTWVMNAGTPSWVQFTNTETKAKFMNAIASGTSGTLTMDWEGVRSLVAWAPFKDNSYFIAAVPEEDVMQLSNNILQYLQWASLARRRVVEVSVVIVIFLSFLFAMVASQTISKPMDLMVDAFKRLAGGDFGVRVDFKTGDERDTLVETFNSIGPQLEHLVETQQALDVAQGIQENLLPAKSPKMKGWEVSGAIKYCDQTGGDYYDYYISRDGEEPVLSVVVGDVSGHGVASALLMTTARALLRVHTECSRLSAASRMTQVNNLLVQDVYGTGQFMTLFYLELTRTSDEIRWVRCGHDPALVYLPEDDAFAELKGSGLPLGVINGFVYEENALSLEQEGTVILLGTDGIWEARKGGYGELFGKDRLRDVIRRNADHSAEFIRDQVLQAVDAWQKDIPNADDVTLVVIKKNREANVGCPDIDACNVGLLTVGKDS